MSQLGDCKAQVKIARAPFFAVCIHWATLDRSGGLLQHPTPKDVRKESHTIRTGTIQRVIVLIGITLALVLILFAGYYVSDRYIHPGAQSDADANMDSMIQAVREQPSNPELRVALAAAFLQAGQVTEALEQAEQTLMLYPEHEGALLIAGVAHARLSQPEAALEPLQRFVGLREDRSMARSDTTLEMAYYYLGQCYGELGQPDQAIAALEKAVAINAVDADALHLLGMAYHASGQPEAALQRYHQAVRLVPDFVEAYQSMEDSYQALDKSDHTIYAQGMIAFSQGKYKTAASRLERATQALPDFAPAFLGLGLSYEQLGQLTDALTALQRAIELDPDSFSAQQARGRIQTAIDSQN